MTTRTKSLGEMRVQANTQKQTDNLSVLGAGSRGKCGPAGLVLYWRVAEDLSHSETLGGRQVPEKSLEV
jgi:hypothetical protein